MSSWFDERAKGQARREADALPPRGISRRRMIQRTAVVGGVAWAAPMVMTTNASAQDRQSTCATPLCGGVGGACCPASQVCGTLGGVAACVGIGAIGAPCSPTNPCDATIAICPAGICVGIAITTAGLNESCAVNSCGPNLTCKQVGATPLSRVCKKNIGQPCTTATASDCNSGFCKNSNSGGSGQNTCQNP